MVAVFGGVAIELAVVYGPFCTPSCLKAVTGGCFSSAALQQAASTAVFQPFIPCFSVVGAGFECVMLRIEACSGYFITVSLLLDAAGR